MEGVPERLRFLARGILHRVPVCASFRAVLVRVWGKFDLGHMALHSCFEQVHFLIAGAFVDGEAFVDGKAFIDGKALEPFVVPNKFENSVMYVGTLGLVSRLTGGGLLLLHSFNEALAPYEVCPCSEESECRWLWHVVFLEPPLSTDTVLPMPVGGLRVAQGSPPCRGGSTDAPLALGGRSGAASAVVSGNAF